MNMDTLRFCPQCQQPLPANAPEGLCPQCLLAAAVAPPSEPQPVTTSGRGDIVDIGDPVAVGKCLPQFEIIALLGRGGMGVVYKARQLNLDRIVALKILPPVDSQSADFVERFRREARALAKLSHPNIVAVHDFGESGGLYYFAMEFVDGANLREMIRTGKMRPEEALAVVPKICDALQFAHEEGVVHRDVKPENILIDKRGRVKIADFGLAKLLRREQADHTLTMTGMTLGTPRYMAPEQLDKPETVDHRADIYSLGVVFYEMLTGEVPMGRFAPPSEKVRIDVRLDEIVLHALERDADRRYQHVSEVRDDVEKVTGKPQVGPIPKSDEPATPPAATPAAHSPNDTEDAEEDGEAEHSVFAAWGGRIIALTAVILAFFNPWGGKAWYFFAAGCAIFGVLSSFGIGRRRSFRSQLPIIGKSGAPNFQSTENIANKPQPGFLRHVIVPMLILLVLCSAIGTLCIAMFEKRDDTVLRMCWRVGSIVVPLAAALLLVRWARLRGIAGSIGPFVLRSLSLRSWTWPLAVLVLVPTAIFVPRPADMKEPQQAMDVFKPTTLITPEGGSYRFIALEEWQKFKPVYAVTLMTGANQNITRTLGWDAKNGASLGFFQRKANWSYQLTATRFDWKSVADGPAEIAPEERAKLRPLVVSELNRREIGRGARLEQFLDHGQQADSVVCWQNLVVLLAWLSLPLAVLTLIWKLREVFVACIGALAFALSAANGIIGGYNNLDWGAIPLAIIATVGVAILFVLHCFEHPAGIRAALPTFTLIVLGAGAGALPWVMAFVAPIPGWHLWHGVAFSLVYFALLLIHLIANGEKFARLRAVSMLVGGLAVIVLAFICTKWPPSVAASINGQPTTFTANVVLPGLVLAENIAFLTAIIGAVTLQQALAAKQNE
jgi:predicted Ser/Thr protein kinase